VWDGKKETPYTEASGCHDCMCLYDGLMSVQEVRREFLSQGFVHSMIFACRSEETAIGFPSGGLFSQTMAKVLDKNKDVSIRDAVRQINELMKSRGFSQTCEAICRKDVLDIPMLASHIQGEKHALCIYDMCRSVIPEAMQEGITWNHIEPGSLKKAEPAHGPYGENAG
jgi:hypothetical protein